MRDDDWENPDGRDLHPTRSQPLKQALSTFLSSIAIDKGILINAQLEQILSTVVPKRIFDHIGAVFIDHSNKRREMVVFVDNSMVAAELQSRSIVLAAMVNRVIINNYPQINMISALKFKVSHRVLRNKRIIKSESQTPSNFELSQPVSLSEEEMHVVEHAGEVICDEKLRNSFKNAMKSNLEWKKGINASHNP